MNKQAQTLANRLTIPENTQAILWDMDGVLIDSLSLSLSVCNQILALHFGESVKLKDSFIKSIFAYDIKEFWRLILIHVGETHGIQDALKVHHEVQRLYESARAESRFELNVGILDILKQAQANALKMAVVSNNPTEEVKDALNKSGILEFFDEVIGNDLEKLDKKPAPDTYLYAAKKLGIQPESCVVIEDSLIGVEAGRKAGCFTIGVATGGTAFEALAESPWTHRTYPSFEALNLSMQFGDVRKKKLISPNDFVSHMVEHIAWRLCVEIQLCWNNDDWLALGKTIGQKIRQFDVIQSQAAALGMIDDGSAEVSIELTPSPTEAGALILTGMEQLDLDWFLSLRAEQIDSGKPLVELMQGLAQGLQARLQVKVCSVQDPHHTWEGVFRSIGIALNRMFTPKHPTALTFESEVTEMAPSGELQVLAKSLHYSKVFRGTAESHVAVAVDFSKKMPNRFLFNVAPNIDVSELPQLLETFAQHADFSLQVEYDATVLNSSHVVLEDTALVLGRALLEIMTLRMVQWGVNGAGSSMHSIDEGNASPIHAGLSVEGRKFWLFVPFKASYETLRKDFLLGQNIYAKLRSEDLDDFLDGLAGGLACSIIVHVHEPVEPDTGWRLIFAALGQSIKEAFAYNPYRKGVPPGVKATLA